MKKLNYIVTSAIILVAIASASAKDDKSINPHYANARSIKVIVNGVPMFKGVTTTDMYNIWEQQTPEECALQKATVDAFSKGDDLTYVDMMSDSKVQKALKRTGKQILAGPMLGDITSSSIKVWVRTITPSTVMIKIGNKSFTAKSTNESDLSAVVDVEGLKPNTTYDYKLFVNDKEIIIDDIRQSFHTPVKEMTDPEGRIIFGSCFHRWGLGNINQANSILSRKPDALLFNGDIAVQDRYGNSAQHREDFMMRDLTDGWRKMVASIPVYATWDDHDYIGNDFAGVPSPSAKKANFKFTPKDRDQIWSAFKYAWCNPYYGNGDGGVYHHTTIGPADVIMLDNRYFRENKKGSFLGDEQMEWLKKRLLESKSPFKILSCGTMWSDYVSEGKDSWGKVDPEGRAKIYKMIMDNNIKGVLLISGDRHGARGFGVPIADDFMLYEFNGASLGGRPGPEPWNNNWKTQLYGISYKFAFSEFTFGGTKRNPEVTFRLWSDRKFLLYERTFSYDELTPKK